MAEFTSAPQALRYLITQIEAAASGEGRSLTDKERAALGFSSTDPDTADVDDPWTDERSQVEFERRIAQLIKRAYRQATHREAQRWAAAVRMLQDGDYYLLVMTGRAGLHRRPFLEWVKLIAAGTALFFVLLGTIIILDRLGIEPTRETGIALLCATAIPVAIGFSLYRRFRKR